MRLCRRKKLYVLGHGVSQLEDGMEQKAIVVNDLPVSLKLQIERALSAIIKTTNFVSL